MFLFVVNVNPAFTMPASSGIKDKLKKIGTVASIQSMPCETDEYAEFVLNGHNILESWGDEEIVAGMMSLVQPTIRPFTNSRQAEDIHALGCGSSCKPMGVKDYRQYVMNKWKSSTKILKLNWTSIPSLKLSKKGLVEPH